MKSSFMAVIIMAVVFSTSAAMAIVCCKSDENWKRDVTVVDVKCSSGSSSQLLVRDGNDKLVSMYIEDAVCEEFLKQTQEFLKCNSVKATLRTKTTEKWLGMSSFEQINGFVDIQPVTGLCM